MPRRRATQGQSKQDDLVANWRRYAAELLGTFVLVFGGTTAIVASGRPGFAAPALVVVPFAFGLALLATRTTSPPLRPSRLPTKPRS